MRLWPGGGVFQRPTTLYEDIRRRGLARRCHSIMLRTTVVGAAAEESMSANHGSIGYERIDCTILMQWKACTL